MGPWTLRIASLLAAAALIAGCGGASQSASSTAPAAASAHVKKAHKKKAHKRRAKRHTSGPSTFPASVRSSFRRSCGQFVRSHATHVPPAYHALISFGVNQYCTCALDRIEASVKVDQFKHDMLAAVYGQAGQPSYMLSAERSCAAQLKATLAQLGIA